MLNRKQLASDAIVRALQLRKRLSVQLEDAVCPLDSAEAIGVDVRLVDLPSMEGMYVAGDSPRIFLSCLRPQGRRRFTCAHELGHHCLGHGQQFDELKIEKKARRIADPQEFAADCFASYFLMPKSTVDNGLLTRGFSYGRLNAEEAYAMSSWLGVGYKTFVRHLHYGLRAINATHAETLLRSTPKSLREKDLGVGAAGQLHIIDSAWRGRALDCEVGDSILAPANAMFEGPAIQDEATHQGHLILKTRCPGIARIFDPDNGWAVFVRVSKQQYVGRSRFRFEEEIE